LFNKLKRNVKPNDSRDFNWQQKNGELVALINQNKIEDAVVLGQELVEYVDRAYRKDSKEKATTYNNMGMVFMLAKDYDLADKCFREALEMRKRIFGKDHNETAIILLNMVQLYKTQAQEILMANRVETKQEL
jgi:tetratricopeptide (TPR) repeat protein